MRRRLIGYLVVLIAAASALTAAGTALVCLRGGDALHAAGWTAAIAFLVTAAASALGAALALRVLRPPSPDAAEGEGYDEYRPLMRRIDEQRRQLREKREALEDRERKLSSITRNMTEGLVLLDGQGLVMLMNDAAARLLGASGAEGRHLLAVCDDNLLQAAVHSAMGGASSRESFSRGGLRVQAIASPVVVDGAVNGVVLLLLDVTARAAAEDMRREFSANVSHELKTPITTISGYAELMMNGLAPPADLPRLTEKIYAEAQRLISLIDDILRLSGLDEGAYGAAREPVALLAAARRCAARLEPMAAACGVSLAVTGEEQVVEGSAPLVDEMLQNLCDNAIKYNRPGGHVELAVGARDGAPLLTVADDGIGIAPEHMGRIFERFYRVDKSRSKATGGTGLGLSIVKHAAAWHRATVEAESVPGAGTRITIRFDGKGGE